MNWYIVWILAFLALLFAVSLRSSKTVKTADNYVMGDFSLGFFPICGSVIATVTGSAALIGAAGKGFTLGVSYLITSLAFVGFTIATVIVLGPTIRRLRLYTLPELFSRRFGRAAALIPALITGLLYMTPTFGMQLVGMAALLSSVTPIPTFWGVLLGFLVTLAFTMIGGLPSVAWTDAIQTVVILAGVVLALVVGIAALGGPAEVVAATPPQLLEFDSIGGMELLNWFLIFGPFYIVWQTTWQRLTAARTPKIGYSAVTIGFIVSGLVSVVAVLIGIAALQRFPADTKPDLVYTSFISEIFPPWLGGLLMVSLVAALLTGATSFLLSGAINISKDIYQGWVNPGAGDQRILVVSRLSVGAMAVLGLVIALLIDDIIAIYELALTFTASTLVMPVLAAMFWRRATSTGVIVSMVAAAAAAVVWRLSGTPFGLHEIAPGLLVSAITLVTVSLVSRHSANESVTAYALEGRETPTDESAADHESRTLSNES